MSRCRACDAILKEKEIIYRQDINEWEDLCLSCRTSVYQDNDDLDIEAIGLDIAEDDYSYKGDE